jgi:hypothetical protein
VTGVKRGGPTGHATLRAGPTQPAGDRLRPGTWCGRRGGYDRIWLGWAPDDGRDEDDPLRNLYYGGGFRFLLGAFR